MVTFFYGAIACMLATYAVLDGFDLGAGALLYFLTRDDRERRQVYAAVGPVWDGNEVWLIAGGGALFFAFPQAYAAGFSGFYLPLMLVLWLLAGRGLGIELRSHFNFPLWRTFWDGVFALSSSLLCIVLGAALGNVLRGVPIERDGWFHVPFFTDFRLGAHPGVLDAYTVLIGAFALATLASHGTLWIAMKTDGPVHERARALARPLWAGVGVLGIAAIAATAYVQPTIYANLLARPIAWPLVVLAAAGFFACGRAILTRRPELHAFLASTAFIVGSLAATVAGLYPIILRSTVDPAFSITAQDAAAAPHGMSAGLWWWSIGVPPAIAYAVIMYRSSRGKVNVP